MLKQTFLLLDDSITMQRIVVSKERERRGNGKPPKYECIHKASANGMYSERKHRIVAFKVKVKLL